MNHKPGSLEEAAQRVMLGEMPRTAASPEQREYKEKVREEAQRVIMYGAATALYHADDDTDLNKEGNEQLKADVMKEVPKQFKRIERLFGYVPGSWSLG